jgi:hypothetical protein
VLNGRHVGDTSTEARGLGYEGTARSLPVNHTLRYQREDCRCKKMLAQCPSKERWRYRVRPFVGGVQLSARRETIAQQREAVAGRQSRYALEGWRHFVLLASKQQKIADGAVIDGTRDARMRSYAIP